MSASVVALVLRIDRKLNDETYHFVVFFFDPNLIVSIAKVMIEIS